MYVHMGVGMGQALRTRLRMARVVGTGRQQATEQSTTRQHHTNKGGPNKGGSNKEGSNKGGMGRVLMRALSRACNPTGRSVVDAFPNPCD